MGPNEFRKIDPVQSPALNPRYAWRLSSTAHRVSASPSSFKVVLETIDAEKPFLVDVRSTPRSNGQPRKPERKPADRKSDHDPSDTLDSFSTLPADQTSGNTIDILV